MKNMTNTTYNNLGIITLEKLGNGRAIVARRYGDRVVRTIPLRLAEARRVYRNLCR